MLVYNATEPASLTSLQTWIEDAERYTNGASFFLVGNKYDSSKSHQVDGGLADAFALQKNIALHFKLSTKHSDNGTISDMLQKMTAHMNKRMEHSFSSTGKHYQTTCSLGQDTVSLIPAVEKPNKSSCCLRS